MALTLRMTGRGGKDVLLSISSMLRYMHPHKKNGVLRACHIFPQTFDDEAQREMTHDIHSGVISKKLFGPWLIAHTHPRTRLSLPTHLPAPFPAEIAPYTALLGRQHQAWSPRATIPSGGRRLRGGSRKSSARKADTAKEG